MQLPPIDLKISAQSIFDDNAAILKLDWLAGYSGAHRSFSQKILEKSSASADLVGHLNLIHPSRIQVLGIAEVLYYQRQREFARQKQIIELAELDAPFLVVADGLEAPYELVLLCSQAAIPLFTTPLAAATIIDHLRAYLSALLAPRTTLHGVFLDVLGIGVLLTGKPGIGKSELGLELINRGHGLVADDMVEFALLGPDFIEGRCPNLLQNILEVRGLGLLDIKTIFGELAVRHKKKLLLVVRLVKNLSKEFQRLPRKNQTVEVLGNPVHEVTLQVAAGRNLAVLVEAAARSRILDLRGIDARSRFVEKQQAAIAPPLSDG